MKCIDVQITFEQSRSPRLSKSPRLTNRTYFRAASYRGRPRNTRAYLREFYIPAKLLRELLGEVVARVLSQLFWPGAVLQVSGFTPPPDQHLAHRHTAHAHRPHSTRRSRTPLTHRRIASSFHRVVSQSCFKSCTRIQQPHHPRSQQVRRSHASRRPLPTATHPLGAFTLSPCGAFSLSLCLSLTH